MVLVTHIAENIVTIPGVKHVMDSCRVKAKLHQAGRVSKAQAKQRAGMVGRESEATFYRRMTAK